MKKWIMINIPEDINPKYLDGFTKVLVENGEKYFVGDSLSWADILAAHCFSSIEPGTDLTAYPVLKKHVGNFLEIPQIKEWVQNRPDTI